MTGKGMMVGMLFLV